MNSDGDGGLLDDPDFKEWAEHTRTQVMPMMQDSALVISLVPKGDADIKFAVELGLSIMLDKPLIIVIAPGQIIAGKLRMVADEIVEWDPDSKAGTKGLMTVLQEFQKKYPDA